MIPRKRRNCATVGDPSRYGDRNGLAIHIHARGGVPYDVREQWQDDETSLDRRLQRWAELFSRGALPGRFPYELRELAREHEHWHDGGKLRDAIHADVLRVLDRKKTRLTPADRRWVEQQILMVVDEQMLLDLSRQLLAARGWRRSAAGGGVCRTTCRYRGGCRMTYLVLTPRDPIVARDGSPFGADSGNRMRSLDWPFPSVLAGSLRTLIGKLDGADFGDGATLEALKQMAIAGPLPLRDGELYFPRPQDIAVREQDGLREAFAARPSPLADGEGCNFPSSGLLPVMLSDAAEEDFKPVRVPAFWSSEKMARWLVDMRGKQFAREHLPQPTRGGDWGRGYLQSLPKDERTHVEIEFELGAAKESRLFTTAALDLSQRGTADSLQLAARVEAPQRFAKVLSAMSALHPLGGERPRCNGRPRARATGRAPPKFARLWSTVSLFA